jgi:NAD-dependent dihydropyrimidine dehydrogenase PreA subunit
VGKVRRKIIAIDEEKCDGCGLCIPSCPEGALAIVDGKAKLVKEQFCDGLGACLGECPKGALRIEEREVEEYDESGVIEHLASISPELVEKHMEHLKAHQEGFESRKTHVHKGLCPSAQVRQWSEAPSDSRDISSIPQIKSELRQWPVQLHLVPPFAPYFKGADLLIAADCVPFAYADFHRSFLKGKAVAVGCPKLDDVHAYYEKLVQIFKGNDIHSITITTMEVPCCRGLVNIVLTALEESGKEISVKEAVVSIKGEIISERIISESEQI